MKTKILGLFVVALLAGPMAHAAVVTYDFTSVSMGNGSFSYDDANTATVSKPVSPSDFWPEGGVWYAALTFEYRGASYSGAIGIYDNYNEGSETFDCIGVAEASIGFPNLSLCGASNLFSGTPLSNANGRTLTNFTTAFVYDGVFIGNVSSLGQRLPTAVPSPGTAWLLLSGLVGLGFLRKRKAT